MPEDIDAMNISNPAMSIVFPAADTLFKLSELPRTTTEMVRNTVYRSTSVKIELKLHNHHLDVI